MNSPTTIKIDNVEYVRKDAMKCVDENVKIVVLVRGFVYVGNVTKEDDYLVISNAYNLRSWGTTKGLGELVSGPTSSTKLDHTGTVRAPFRAVISVIDTEKGKWKLC